MTRANSGSRIESVATVSSVAFGVISTFAAPARRRAVCACAGPTAAWRNARFKAAATTIARTMCLPYQTNRKPNCIVRPSSAVVMVPTVAFEMFRSGLPKFA